ncbi:UNVERIFIED_ORG: hypothetical protein DFO49_5013 [Herbaspirillum seropedicae]
MKTPSPKKIRQTTAKAPKGKNPRRPRSRWLSYDAGTLTYLGEHEIKNIRLSQWYLPPAAGQPHVTALSDHPHYIESLLSLLDEFIDATKSKHPRPEEIRKQCSVFLRVIDWLRGHSVYRLSDARREHFMALAKDVAAGGWMSALNYEQRMSETLERLSADQLREGLYYPTPQGTYSALRAPFWSRELGWGPEHYLSPKSKAYIETQMGDGDATWRRRKDHPGEPPTEASLRSILADLNRLSHLSDDVDRLGFRPFKRPAATARHLAKRRTNVTENLALEDAVLILEKTVFTLYELAPLLHELLERLQIAQIQMGRKRLQQYLHTLPSALELGKIFELPLRRFSEMGKRAPQEREEAKSLSVDTVIGFVQSACAIAIGALTAHRPDEIAGRHNGLRVGDLALETTGDSIATLTIHFGKSFRERREIYVSRIVIDACRCLEKIKCLSLPDRSMKPQDGDSLFVSHRPSRDHDGTLVHFSMVPQPQAARSSTNFIAFCFKDRKVAPNFEHRMLRRFHAQLYMRRYSHPKIKVLAHILGHIWIDNTVGYAFDEPSVQPGRRGEDRIGSRNIDRSRDAREIKALQEMLNMKPEFDAVAKEMLQEHINTLISEEGAAGGFSRFIRKLYSSLLGNIEFASAPESEQIIEITDLVFKKGYQVTPMFHGECLANKEGRLIERAICHENGELRRENAGPVTCRKCPFHYSDSAYISNLEELLVELNRDADDFMLSPLQQHNARKDADNIVRIIQLNRETMAENRKVISLLKVGEPS